MRSIALDTETTGSSAAKGDRIIEIGLVEMVDFEPTGKTFQSYFKAQHPMNPYAQKVHGLSAKFLSDKPLFSDRSDEILDFIGQSPCFAHGARFDRDMFIYDFHHAGLDIPEVKFFDTLPLFRATINLPKYKLDVVARSLGATQQDRGLHGALEDADILARCLQGVRQKHPESFARALRGQSPMTRLPNGFEQKKPANDLFSARSTLKQPVDTRGGRGAGGGTKSSSPERMSPEQKLLRAAVLAAREMSEDIDQMSTLLKRSGIKTWFQIKTDRSIQSVSFSGLGATLRGSQVGMRMSGLPAGFRTLARNARPQTADPDLSIGGGLLPGVDEIIKYQNSLSGPMSEEDMRAMRSGRDQWSSTPPNLIYQKILSAYGAERIEAALEGCSETDRAASIRWMGRGLEPERASAWIDAKMEAYAHKYDAAPSP